MHIRREPTSVAHTTPAEGLAVPPGRYGPRVAITICVLLCAIAEREESLAHYEDQVLALLGEHEGRVVARLRAIEGPFTEVQVLEFACEESLARFQDDPRRRALSDLREASIASTTVVRVEAIG
jgi:uncharacterized protein (DUF1330 family)